MFLPQGGRRRARPSLKSIALSVLVLIGSIYAVTTVFLLAYIYVPIAAGGVIALAVFAYRGRILFERMPPPYGKGRTSKVDAKSALRSGILLTLLGGLSLIVLMGSVFFLTPDLFFTLLFGVIIGLPLSEVFFFALTSIYERRSRARIYFFSEETGTEDEPLLLKGVEVSEE